MSEENKAIVHRLYEEVFNRGNLTAADTVVAANFVEHEEFPGLAPGLEGFKQMVAMLRAGFPDARMTADVMLAEGDLVTSRYIFKGTHRGAFMDIPPTGKEVTMTGIEILRFAGGKVVEHWGNSDTMGLMQQLGVIPPSG